MGNRRSAYPWIQRIPAKPQFWYGSNISRFTPHILSGVFITSCSLNRGIEDFYGFLTCCPYNVGLPARPLVPFPCPCLSHLPPCTLCTLLVCPQFCSVTHSLFSFNTHSSAPSLLWAPKHLNPPQQPSVLSTLYQLHPAGLAAGSICAVMSRGPHLLLEGLMGWLATRPAMLSSTKWMRNESTFSYSKGSSSQSLSLNSKCRNFC